MTLAPNDDYCVKKRRDPAFHKSTSSKAKNPGYKISALDSYRRVGRPKALDDASLNRTVNFHDSID